ncbi:MAG: helix-turn-helix domain-containing protein [Steroidobacteraceae bacterium]
MSEYRALTVGEAAKILRCNLDTVRRLAACGKIPARKLGKRWLFDPEQLRAYVRGEWQSSGEIRPMAPGGSDSELAARLFAEAPTPRSERRPKSTSRAFAIVTGGRSS